MIVKRMRPWIVGCVEIKELCNCIDVAVKFLRRGTMATLSPQGVPDSPSWVDEGTADNEGLQRLTIKKLETFSSKKLMQDMQERLLLMSHYKL